MGKTFIRKDTNLIVELIGFIDGGVIVKVIKEGTSFIPGDTINMSNKFFGKYFVEAR